MTDEQAQIVINKLNEKSQTIVSMWQDFWGEMSKLEVIPPLKDVRKYHIRDKFRYDGEGSRDIIDLGLNRIEFGIDGDHCVDRNNVYTRFEFLDSSSYLYDNLLDFKEKGYISDCRYEVKDLVPHQFKIYENDRHFWLTTALIHNKPQKVIEIDDYLNKYIKTFPKYAKGLVKEFVSACNRMNEVINSKNEEADLLLKRFGMVSDKPEKKYTYTIKVIKKEIK